MLDRPRVLANIEKPHVEPTHRLGRPQAQCGDGLCGVAGNDGVVSNGEDIVRTEPARHAILPFNASAEPHRVCELRPGKFPRVADRQPVVRVFCLVSVPDELDEGAVLVANAVAERRQSQGRQGVEEAGGEAAEAAIPEPGLGLELAQVFKRDAQLMERSPIFVAEIEREEVVDQDPSDQEFHR